jgi:hypothetical protein
MRGFYLDTSKQVSNLKKQYPGVVLMFEVGYKCLLFEEDAEVNPITPAPLSSLIMFRRSPTES